MYSYINRNNNISMYVINDVIDTKAQHCFNNIKTVS